MKKQRRSNAERMQSPTYTPNRVINHVVAMLNLKSDAQLAGMLDILPSEICRIRKRRRYINEFILVRLHDATGLSIAQLRDLMGGETEEDA